METTNVRLAPRTSRVPLDDVLIELTHDDFDDRFDADGVNVGLGGLSMRAAILPDVGSRLRCSFQSPADGEHVEAGCEVVWAADSGRYMGEFGLRFIDVDTRSAVALRKLVADWSHLSEDEVDSRRDDADDADGESPAIELRLDGVASPLVAELVHGSGDAMVVEQELPFLRLGTGIEAEDGRRGHLHSVDLRLDGELPRLVLTICYDGRSEGDIDAEPGGDPGIDRENDADYEAAAGSAAGEFEAAVAEPAEPLDTIPDAPGTGADVADDIHDEASLAAFEAAGEDHVQYGRSLDFEGAYRGVPEPALRHSEDDDDAAMPRGRDLVGDIRARLVPAIAAFRAYLITLWARLVPAARRAVERARRAGSNARAQGGPMIERSASRLVSTARRFLAIFRERAAAQGGTKRRAQVRRVQTSRAMPRSGRDEEPIAPSAAKNRKVLLAAVTLGVLGLGAYAALASDTAPEPVAEQAAAPAPAAPAAPSAYGAPAPSAYAPAPSAYGAPAPTSYAPQATTYASAAHPTPAPSYAPPPVAVAQPEVPRALPEPDYEAGPMPPPTYPAISDERPSSAPDPASSGGQSFGAASVPNGTPFTLNMSTPIGAIYGEATDWGFIVRIPGSLSLSRASPIAQNHPHVERAAIRNLGDSAELTIRFVEGRNPAYRVEARGTRLIVILGR